MDIYVLDKKFQSVAIIDDYISIVWTERYAKNGDFSMEIRAQNLYKYHIQPGYFLWKKDSKTAMVVQYIRLKTNSDRDDVVQLKGDSLATYLDRRVCEGNTVYDETVIKTVFETIISTNITEPKNENRKADMILDELPKSTEDNKFSTTLRGETVGDVIRLLCKQFDYGYEFYRSESGTFHLRIYEGKDRSWKQNALPWRVYSPRFNNLLTSEFVYDDTKQYTGYVICGETESQTTNPTTGALYEWPQVWVSTDEDDAAGWDRKEGFIDGSSISRWQGDYLWGTFDPKPPESVTHGWKKLPESIYKKLLLYKTEEVRNENSDTMEFQAEGDPNLQWKLGEDVFLGDIVQVINEYGVVARCRLTEFIWTQDTSGIRFYPTFEAIMDSPEGGLEWLSPLGSTTRQTTIGCTTLNNS